METVRLDRARAESLAAVKALGMPTEVFRFTQHNGDQHEVECSHEGMAIGLCDERADIAYVTDLDGNLLGGEFLTKAEED